MPAVTHLIRLQHTHPARRAVRVNLLPKQLNNPRVCALEVLSPHSLVRLVEAPVLVQSHRPLRGVLEGVPDGVDERDRRLGEQEKFELDVFEFLIREGMLNVHIPDNRESLSDIDHFDTPQEEHTHR